MHMINVKRLYAISIRNTKLFQNVSGTFTKQIFCSVIELKAYFAVTYPNELFGNEDIQSSAIVPNNKVLKPVG